MARYWFGGSAADVVWASVPGPGYSLVAQSVGLVTIWDSATGGTRLTDLLDANGAAITSLIPGALGVLPRFQGPDQIMTVYADAGLGTRVRLNVDPRDAANGMNKSLARTPDALISGTVTRDANGAATSAPVTWPDGSPGTYTADTLSTAFPGAVDGYHITYGSPVTKTYTQPTITRDSTGAATVVPAIVVS